MIVARMFSPVTTLGPGKRVGLWTMGCRKACKGCISSELAIFDPKRDIPIQFISMQLKAMAVNNKCTGLVVSGGDPFEQSQELVDLLKLVRDDFEDILVFTGYTKGEILDGVQGDAGKEALAYIDVLVDGRYVEQLNNGHDALRGSSNQTIWFLSPEKEEAYRAYINQGRTIETFIHANHVVSVGIPGKI